MTTHHSGNGLIDAPIRQVEDPLLITGNGCYVDDIELPRMLHMVVLRSPYMHAKIISIKTAFFDPKREAWGFGAHVALVKIDRETGKVTIEKLVLVDDCGVIINPMIVEGQVHGGVAQGLGEALREQMLFGDEGQVLTGTFMNYAVMTAGD